MIHNWKPGHIPPHNIFGFFISAAPFSCVVQAQFQVQLMSRTTFLQMGENDEDTTPMYMTMIGAWNGVE
jgi:hypothetical protein